MTTMTTKTNNGGEEIFSASVDSTGEALEATCTSEAIEAEAEDIALERADNLGELIAAAIALDEQTAIKTFAESGFSEDDYRRVRREVVEYFKQGKAENAELSEIKRLYPFETGESLDKIENYDAYRKLREAGLTPSEAYRGANAERIIERGKNSVSALRGKSRTALKINSTGAILPPIPRDELALWQSAFPKKSEKELKRLYYESNR